MATEPLGFSDAIARAAKPAPITIPDGRLIRLLTRADAQQALERLAL